MDPFDLRQWSGFSAAGGDSTRPAMIQQVAIDSRHIDTLETLFVALPGHLTDGHQYINEASQSGAKFILVKNHTEITPVNPHTTILRVDDPLKSMQDVATCYRKTLPVKMIAITGSYGKTMVKDLLFRFLETTYKTCASPESFNSQIGVALSLFNLSYKDEIAIIEAAISEKEEMNRLASMIAPQFGIVTQIELKNHHAIADIATLCQELLKLFTVKSELKWVLMPANETLMSHVNTIPADTFYWNQLEDKSPFAKRLQDKHEVCIPYRIDFPDSSSFEGSMTSGYYYYLDLLNICLKAAWKLGVTSQNICKILNHYVVEPTRTEIWKSTQGVTFFNDTYSQDPQSIEKTFRFLEQMTGKGRKIFLFGGLRGAAGAHDYHKTGKILASKKIDFLYLIGDHPYAPLIDVINASSPTTSVLRLPTYEDSLQILKNSWIVDDTVLIKGEKKEPLDKLTETFNESIYTNLCFINLAAISHNLQQIRNKLPPFTRIMCMVKALGYGTDEIRIAKFLQTCGIEILGVSYVDEAIALKRGGVTQSIFVLNAADYELSKAISWNLEIGVSNLSQIKMIAELAKNEKKQVKVHLHIDTGMSRFGSRPEEAISLCKEIFSHPELALEGIMTHLSCADNPDEDLFTREQTKKLDTIISELEAKGYKIPWKHVANSAAAIRFHLPQYNMVRIGLALYGLQTSEATEKAIKFRLAVSLMTRIVGMNVCKKGESISYGRTYKVSAETQKIAVLPIGYFDGLHRHYSGQGYVLIGGYRAPMIGRICMDFMMVDLTCIPHAKIGDPVLIFGEDEHGDYLSPEDFALRGHSIAHELLTCLGPRIQRIFIYEETQEKIGHGYKK